MSAPRSAIACSAASRASDGSAVHQDVGVLGDQPRRGREDDRRHDQGGDRVALGESRRGRRAGRRAPRASPPCRRRSETRSSAALRCRSGGRPRARRRAAEIHDQRDRDHRELVPADFAGAAAPSMQVADRLDAHQQAAGEQDRRLAQRAEVLGAAVAVGVLAVGRPPAQAHGEEREHRGDHVPA